MLLDQPQLSTIRLSSLSKCTSPLIPWVDGMSQHTIRAIEGKEIPISRNMFVVEETLTLARLSSISVQFICIAPVMVCYFRTTLYWACTGGKTKALQWRRNGGKKTILKIKTQNQCFHKIIELNNDRNVHRIFFL